MITLTQKAAEKVRKTIAHRGHGVGIRVGVRTTGCSGLAYKLEYVDSPEPEDVQYTSYDVNIFVDPKSLAYVAGLQMDYIRQGLNEGFDFKNPNERDRCGCGESFRV